MKKALLLLNASSGRTHIKGETFMIIEKLVRAGYEVTTSPIIPSEGIEASLYLNGPSSNYDLVVCAGGDGTLSHTAKAVMAIEASKRPALGFLPTGSTNDFAKSFRIPEELEKACDVIINGRRFAYDTGLFNNMFFNYVTAFGALTKISYATDQRFKNIFGHAAYILQILGTFPKELAFKTHMKIKTDVFEEEGDFLIGAVFNSRSVAGISLDFLEDMATDDGLLEMILIRSPKNIVDLSTIGQHLLAHNLDHPAISVHHIKHCEIEADREIDWSLDGEFGGTFDRVVIDVCPRSLSIMIPETQSLVENES